MTQTALYSDKNLFLSLYKSALRRIRGIGIIYLLISFITFPMTYIMEAVEAVERLQQGYSYYGFEGNPEIYTGVAAVLYFAVVIAGAILISTYVNSFMHSKKAVDVFHALPVKRPQMLVANFAAALTVLLTVQFICYSIVAVSGAVILSVQPLEIIVEMLRVALVTAVICAITFFCCVCCNASLDSVVFTAAFLAIVPAYTGLICFLMEEFVMGFSVSEKVLYTAVKFSPAVMMYETFMRGDEFSQGLLLSCIYAAAVILIMMLSCRVYTRRKSEIAQSASTKSPLYQFILLAASVGGGIFFGFFYQMIFGSSWDSIVHIGITSCVFTVAIYLVFNAVVSRNPKPTKRGLMGLGVSLVLTVAFLLCIDSGCFGYESYIPDTADIKSVTVNYKGDYDEISKLEYNRYGELYTTYSGAYPEFADAAEIEAVRNIHKEIVNSIDQNDIQVMYRNVTIQYTMNNGKTVIRGYDEEVPVEVLKMLAALEDLESFKKQLYPVFKVDAGAVESFDIKDGFGKNVQTVKLSDEDKELLYSAIAQDTLNITRQKKDQRTGPVLARIQINYSSDLDVIEKYINVPQNSFSSFRAPQAAAVETTSAYYHAKEKNQMALYDNVLFDVTEDCINTISALKNIGLEQYTTLTVPEGIKAVAMYTYYPYRESRQAPYYRTNTYFTQYEFAENARWEEPERVKIYTDADKVSQLAQASKARLYAPAQKDCYYAVVFMDEDVDFHIKEADDYDFMAYYVSANDAPDFIKKDFAKFSGELMEIGYLKSIG